MLLPLILLAFVIWAMVNNRISKYAGFALSSAGAGDAAKPAQTADTILQSSGIAV